MATKVRARKLFLLEDYFSIESFIAEQIINAAKNEFFTPERLSYIFEKIIMHYFLLSYDEFELWDSDPESYVSDEGGDSWKYNLRVI